MPVWTPDPPLRDPVPLTSSVGERIWRRVPGFMREADDGTLWALCVAMGEPVEGQARIVTDPRVLTDPDRVPFARLPWLAGLAGVDLSGVPEGQRRLVLADPRGQLRGTPEAIAMRVGMVLVAVMSSLDVVGPAPEGSDPPSVSGLVTVVCPYLGDPWRMYVSTLDVETPDPEAVREAIRAECPAWLRVTFETVDAGRTYAALGAAYGTYAAMRDTGKTYGRLAGEA